ncbi:MAG: hypothetical protein GXC73_18940, partial [Chitinophagaceae bacterium]|nr:hypothetical protein [Chitinophagaceae bacterium]
HDHDYVSINQIDDYIIVLTNLSDDVGLLKLALSWSERVSETGELMLGLKYNPLLPVLWQKNRANLIYRLGNKKEAIDVFKTVIGKFNGEDYPLLLLVSNAMNAVIKNEKFWEESRAKILKNKK